VSESLGTPAYHAPALGMSAVPASSSRACSTYMHACARSCGWGSAPAPVHWLSPPTPCIPLAAYTHLLLELSACFIPDRPSGRSIAVSSPAPPPCSSRPSSSTSSSPPSSPLLSRPSCAADARATARVAEVSSDAHDSGAAEGAGHWMLYSVACSPSVASLPALRSTWCSRAQRGRCSTAAHTAFVAAGRAGKCRRAAARAESKKQRTPGASVN